MKRIKYLVLGIVLGGAAVAGALQYHLLQTTEGMVLVPKTDSTLSDTYVDIRDFGVSEWNEHRNIVDALLKADRQDVLKGSAVDGIKQSVDNILDRLGS